MGNIKMAIINAKIVLVHAIDANNQIPLSVLNVKIKLQFFLLRMKPVLM